MEDRTWAILSLATGLDLEVGDMSSSLDAATKQIGDQIGADLIGNPELANDPTIAGKILAQFLKNHETRIRSALSANDLVSARKAVNGGTNGIEGFVESYQIGDRVLPAGAG